MRVVRRIERSAEDADTSEALQAQSLGRRNSLYSRASGVPSAGFQS
jgi:hypothetical protein